MNKADKEIIKILKETFRSKKNDIFYDPDELMREFFLKILLTFSILSLILLVISKLQGGELSGIKMMTSGITTVFFGILSIHLNNKSENFSLILFGITFISMLISINLL